MIFLPMNGFLYIRGLEAKVLLKLTIAALAFGVCSSVYPETITITEDTSFIGGSGKVYLTEKNITIGTFGGIENTIYLSRGSVIEHVSGIRNSVYAEPNATVERVTGIDPVVYENV